MNIIFITSNYPSHVKPNAGTFTHELVHAWVRMGHHCTVINPLSYFDALRGGLGYSYSHEDASKDATVEVYRPRYVSASAIKLGFFNTDSITRLNYNQAVWKIIKRIDRRLDILYGHFLYPSGGLVANIGWKLGVPSFAAFGDDRLGEGRHALARKDFRKISGIVSVSTRNKLFCENVLNLPPEKIGVFPNGVSSDLFFQRNRLKMRVKYGFPKGKIIIAFNGHFIHRKGPDRLLEAVKGLDVRLIFLGKGSIPLEDERIIFKGVVTHKQVPEIISASDIFVLPTLSEGSCNAVVEAIACGLPVISSIGDFNDDILNDDVSLRVDPLNVAQIREAVLALMNDDQQRLKMSEAALEFSRNFDINDRARRILAWMEEIIETKSSVS
ncbi:MAG: glycosyltransferase [Candidatus Electryonea clarkiae]|nr:glycosyltransferase [Candidatus Electryonea clarkiae]MDP8289176.1 glycosyltransferase [Candidatus Electryonea clarkiae]